MNPDNLFGREGQQHLDAQQDMLFPTTVRPRFLRLLWIALLLLAAAGTLLAIGTGRLP